MKRAVVTEGLTVGFFEWLGILRRGRLDICS